MNEPVGTIGMICPDNYPLLGLSHLSLPFAMGNTRVVVPSVPYPLATTDLYQVFETSDLPAGDQSGNCQTRRSHRIHIGPYELGCGLVFGSS